MPSKTTVNAETLAPVLRRIMARAKARKATQAAVGPEPQFNLSAAERARLRRRA